MFRLKASDLTKPAMRDPPTLAAAVKRIGLAGGIYLLLLYLIAYAYGLATAMFAALALSIVFIPLLVPAVLAVIPALIRFAGDRSMERWQGCYYAYEDLQVRIIEYRGTIWIVLADVYRACQLRVSDDELIQLGPGAVGDVEEFGERALSDKALLEVLSRRQYREAVKFKLWLERDVLPPLYRRRTGERVPYQFGGGPRAHESGAPNEKA